MLALERPKENAQETGLWLVVSNSLELAYAKSRHGWLLIVLLLLFLCRFVSLSVTGLGEAHLGVAYASH